MEKVIWTDPAGCLHRWDLIIFPLQFHLAKLWSESFSASLENDQNDQWHIFSAHIANACAACFCRSWFWGERGGATAKKKKSYWSLPVLVSLTRTGQHIATQQGNGCVVICADVFIPYSWRPLSRACCVAMQRSVNEMSLLRLFWPWMPLPLCLWTLRGCLNGAGCDLGGVLRFTLQISLMVVWTHHPTSQVCVVYIFMYVSVRRDDQNHGYCMSSCAAAD